MLILAVNAFAGNGALPFYAVSKVAYMRHVVSKSVYIARRQGQTEEDEAAAAATLYCSEQFVALEPLRRFSDARSSRVRGLEGR